MQQVILATTNQGKIKEFQKLLEPLGVEVVSIHGLEKEKIPDVIEDGLTFEENALKKAEAFHQVFGLPALADDSGLEVDALGGKPGIYSARYAGEDKSDQANIEKVLRELDQVPEQERSARFVCAIAFVDGAEASTVVRGECSGYIAQKGAGDAGFGYDPIFYLPELKKTMAQLSSTEKNRISHRYQALQKLVKKMEPIIVD